MTLKFLAQVFIRALLSVLGIGAGQSNCSGGLRSRGIVAPLTGTGLARFWDESRSKLQKVDPQYQLLRKPELSKGDLNVYEVRMRSYGDIRVSGWYEVPKSKGPHPVILRLPGYGSSMKPIARFKDMIVFSFNPRGHGQDDVKGKPSDFWVRGWITRKATIIRALIWIACAVDFVFSRRSRFERIAVRRR